MKQKKTRMFPAPHSTFTDIMTAVAVRSDKLGLRPVLAESKITQQMSCRRKKLFGPLSEYLNSRTGARWSRVVAELYERLNSEVDFRRVLPELTELVEVHVLKQDGVLRHGTGLLKGQVLQPGWKRRLYVCPESGRLRRILPSVSTGQRDV